MCYMYMYLYQYYNYVHSSGDSVIFTIHYTEINIKQQLVNQLEKAQKSLNSLRGQYEEKMLLLQNQIRQTEAERDKFIKDISKAEMNWIILGSWMLSYKDHKYMYTVYMYYITACVGQQLYNYIGSLFLLLCGQLSPIHAHYALFCLLYTSLLQTDCTVYIIHFHITCNQLLPLSLFL